jgi:hypothetical protein
VNPQPTVISVLTQICRDPLGTLIYRWNWKSAIFSPVFRAMIFFFANLSAGWRAATAAALFEFLYRAPSAGIYGALTQAFRTAHPAWAAGLTTMLLLPLVSHGIEFLLHLARGTPRLGASILASCCFTMLSTLFNLFAMRRGVLVTDVDGGSIGSDLRRLPQVVLAFLLVGPLALSGAWRTFSQRQFGTD